MMIVLFYFFHFFLNFSNMVNGEVVDMTDMTWDGIGGFIVVDREAVQGRIDEYTQNGGQRLYLPIGSALPELSSSQHVVAFGFSNVTALNFGDDECISSSGLELSAVIPFLSTSADGPPNSALTLGVFYERGRSNVAGINFICQDFTVDVIELTKDQAYLIDGEDELIFNIERSLPCVAPSSAIQHDYEIVVDGDLLFGVPEPKFPICSSHPIQNQFCTNARNYAEAVTRLAPNICQFFSVKGQIESCKAKVTIERITPVFREFMLLPQSGDVTVILSETSFEESTVKMKLPCVE